MPELPTYTASGNIRTGPVAPSVDASVLDRPARALVGLGGNFEQTAGEIGQLAEQRKREDELRWATETTAQYSRVLAERRAEDAKNPRETEGIEFRDFADQTLADYTKAAPSRRAADMFRAKGLGLANDGYEKALHSGEITRLLNADASNEKATADIVSTYKTTSSLDNPVGAAQDIAPLVQSQLASIETRFGQTMPLKAERMRNHLVSEVALGTASTNPDYAHQLVNGAPIDEKFKVTLNTEIDRISRNANETASFNLVKLIENSIQVGYDKLTPVPAPSPAVMATLPKEQAARLNHEVNVANRTISEFSKIRSWNWQYQREAVANIDIKGDPVAQDARKQLAEQLAKSEQQQTKDPVGWQLTNDPEFQNVSPNETSVQRMVRLDRMVSLQGPAPEGVPPEQQKRYLNLPTGLQKVLSEDQARRRAATFKSTPNQITANIEQFDAEWPNARLAGMAWNDMLHLPESERLPMGLRVGAAIHDPDVRNNFVGVMTNKEITKPKDTKTVFEAQLSGDQTYARFISGWNIDNQRGTELSEFSDSVLKYAMHISATQGYSTKDAVKLAVKRTISDNYAIININGTEVPIYRFPRGGPVYADDAADAIRAGIQDSLNNLDVNSIATDLQHFPLQPRLPGEQKEANKYLQHTIHSTGTVAVEPDGKSATVYVKGDGVNDFPFQLRGADGQPLVLDFDNMMTRGVVIQKAQERAGTPAENEKRRLESYKRLGINPKTGRKE